MSFLIEKGFPSPMIRRATYASGCKQTVIDMFGAVSGGIPVAGLARLDIDPDCRCRLNTAYLLLSSTDSSLLPMLKRRIRLHKMREDAELLKEVVAAAVDWGLGSTDVKVVKDKAFELTKRLKHSGGVTLRVKHNAANDCDFISEVSITADLQADFGSHSVTVIFRINRPGGDVYFAANRPADQIWGSREMRAAIQAYNAINIENYTSMRPNVARAFIKSNVQKRLSSDGIDAVKASMLAMLVADMQRARLEELLNRAAEQADKFVVWLDD